MVLYRDVDYKEYERLFLGKSIPFCNENKYADESNSFTYEKGKNHVHFFRYFEHAKMYLPLFGEMIIKYEIPDSKIVEEGYGCYEYKKVIAAAIPEYIIDSNDYSIDYVREINPSIRKNIKKVNGINEVLLYNELLQDLYRQWCGEIRSASDISRDFYNFYLYVVNYFKQYGYEKVINLYAESFNKNEIKVKVKK